MKNLKLLILGFGMLGLLSQITAPGPIAVVCLLAPVAMGVLGLLRPPLPWEAAGLALAGFAGVAVRHRYWDVLPAGFWGRLELGAVALGVVVSVLAMIRPEARA